MAPGVKFSCHHVRRFKGIYNFCTNVPLYKSIEELQRTEKDVTERLTRLESHPLHKEKVSVCELCPYEYQSLGCLSTPCSIRNYLEKKDDKDG